MAKKKKPASKRPAKENLATERSPRERPSKTLAQVAKSGPAKAVPKDAVKPARPAARHLDEKAVARADHAGAGAPAQLKAATPKTAAAKPTGTPSPARGKQAEILEPVSVVPDAVLEAARPLQSFASDMQRMAKTTIEQTTQVLEQLRSAKSVAEVVSLQTTFMQQTFRGYTEFAGRISELMTASQASLFHQGQAAMRSFRSIASATLPSDPRSAAQGAPSAHPR